MVAGEPPPSFFPKAPSGAMSALTSAQVERQRVDDGRETGKLELHVQGDRVMELGAGLNSFRSSH